MSKAAPASLLLPLACLLCLQGSPSQELPRIVSVGWDYSPPYQTSSGGEPRGIDLEIIDAALARIGYRPDFRKLAWARQLAMQEAGDLDIMLGASFSAERAVWAAWSLPYRSERVVLFGLEGDRRTVPSLASLIGSGVRIGVVQDSVYGGEFGELADNPGFAALLERAPDIEANLRKLRGGRLDFIIEEPGALLALAARTPGTGLRAMHSIFEEKVAFMVGKKTLALEPGFLARLDAALEALRREGVIARILASHGLKE